MSDDGGSDDREIFRRHFRGTVRPQPEPCGMSIEDLILALCLARDVEREHGVRFRTTRHAQAAAVAAINARRPIGNAETREP